MIQGETVAFETKKGSVKRFCPVTIWLFSAYLDVL